MTYVNYLGCNQKLPIGDKFETEELGLIDETFFSDPAEGMENIRKHISSKYIYQVDTNGGGAILFDGYLKETSPHNYRKTIKDMEALCAFLRKHLVSGDVCEMYTCLDGEELEERDIELDKTITFNNCDMNGVEVNDRQLLVIKI
ncbi:hypothetical protein [Peribacillus frigoritolerans]|uniref:hypothetical protein n=1 Tax=Peribacillus castrilensis TaxID=2897690 RepID=UPI002DCFD38D|nr:hypothetical protein [Peribacillus castrilensis]